MSEQVFALSDLPRVFALGFLEMLLSADNAVILGILCSALPLPLRRKALFIGVASSFILRALALLLVAHILVYTWIQAVGGAYLIYLSIRHLIKKKQRSATPPTKSHSFWKTVVLIEIFDLLFALDSIIAGVAFVNSNLSKLWIVYAGGMIGLLSMRFAASFFSTLIDRFPGLETGAYLMVGWIGIKLGLSSIQWHLPIPLFWGVLVFLFVLGFFSRKR
jgi:YkoY family integral membrane protein